MYFQTGQKNCYDEQGDIIPCGATGQDGEYRKGIEIDLVNRFHDNQKGVVKDNLTGLYWTKDAALTTFPVSWKDALKFVQDMNENSFLGFNDWRMPNRKELRSIIYLEAKNPALPHGHPFKNIFNGWYWTSTTAAINHEYAWYIHLGGARMFYGRKDQQCMLWLVRGESKILPVTGQTKCYDEKGHEIKCMGTGQDGELRMGLSWPKDRFNHMDLVVEDRLTGLIWTKDADLSKGLVSWMDALHLIKGLNANAYGGFKDWRLPNINELESLVDGSSHSPALPKYSFFENVREFYWSSTTSYYDPPWAWALYMKKGATGVGLKRLKNFFVWAVRG